jgi:hypothetical protein
MKRLLLLLQELERTPYGSLTPRPSSALTGSNGIPEARAQGEYPMLQR